MIRHKHTVHRLMQVSVLVLLQVACSEESVQGTQTPPAPTYERVAGDDWKYASRTALRAADYFWWFDSRDVYNYVQLEPDPLFGQVVRVTQPANSGEPGPSPRLIKRFPAIDKMWFRWRMKFSRGWTTIGPEPPAANAYKIAFWTFPNQDGRGGLEYTNTDQYLGEFGVRDRSTGQYASYAETLLPGSAPNFGNASTDAATFGSHPWTDGEWWEFVVYYEKTGATSARQMFWRRRLTRNGAPDATSWLFFGWSMTGGVTPSISAVELGANKNRSTPTDQHIYWGPWEVVNGATYANPFGMPNL